MTTNCNDCTPSLSPACPPICPSVDLRSMLIGVAAVVGIEVFAVVFVLIANRLGA